MSKLVFGMKQSLPLLRFGSLAAVKHWVTIHTRRVPAPNRR